VTPASRRLHVSTENSAFQVLESLVSNRVKRHRSRTFVLEGVQPITRALAHGWTFEAVIHESGARLSDWATDVIARAGAAVRYEMTPELLARLSGRTDTSELLAVVRMREESFAQIPVHGGLLAVVMDRPGNPGNLGTLIRSCDALGASGLVVTGHAVDLYDPATLTASRGSIFALPVVQAASHAEVLQWVASVRERLGRCNLVGTDERADTDLAAHDFTAPTVLVVGNETHGLSRAYRDACDAVVRIPMSGSASSLNVSVAASIALYEVARQRAPESNPSPITPGV
jgi:tRNA G18 (ribose-2'-O)-methylase SpoU